MKIESQSEQCMQQMNFSQTKGQSTKTNGVNMGLKLNNIEFKSNLSDFTVSLDVFLVM